jgi:type IV fimbrial biogenesis protein FimT
MHATRRSRYGPRGLTLIEVAIALAVLAVLVSLSIPSLANHLQRQRLKSAAEALSADLAETRFEAARRGQTLHMGFVAGPQWCWAMANAAGCNCHGTLPCQLKTVQAGDLRGVELAQADDAEFDATGTAAGAGSALLRTAHGDELRVSLSVLGRVRVCSPDGGMAAYPRC